MSPDDEPPQTPDAAVAHAQAIFADAKARRAALVEQARGWTGLESDELGTLDEVAPLASRDVDSLYARLVALSAQRVRVLSGQLNAAYAEHGTDALVSHRQVFNPATGEVEDAGEVVSTLAKLDAEERDRLERLLTTAVRLKLETRSADALASQGRMMAALARALCEQAGLDWGAEETRRLAQQAVLTARSEVARPG